jgi:tetratricopeptide (TPR) repeat protein
MKTTALEEFAENKVAFVAYSYDRTLEQFMLISIMNTYGKGETNCAEVLAHIPILRLHGRLGYLPRQGQEALVPFPSDRPIAQTIEACHLYFQGMVWFNKGRNPEDLARARGYFERALALDPDNLDALLGAISVDLQAATGYRTDDPAPRYSAIEATLTKVLSRSPNNAWAHYLMCRAQNHTKRQAQGIAECERALALNPNLASARPTSGLPISPGATCLTMTHICPGPASADPPAPTAASRLL